MMFSFDKEYVGNHKFKIAMFVANGVNGDSRVIKTADTLRKMGYEVLLVGVATRKEKNFLKGFTFEALLLPHPKHEIISKGLDWKSESGVNYQEYTAILSRELLSVLEEHEFNFLHTHDMVGLAVGGMVYDKYEGQSFKWIHDVHEYVSGLTEINSETRRFFEACESRYISVPDHITCVSNELSVILKNEYSLEKYPDVIYNSPRQSSFDEFYHRDIRSDVGLPVKTPLAVYCGNVKEIRGVDLIIKALPRIDDLHVAIITNSNNDYVNKIKDEIKSFGIDDRVHFLPYVNYDDLVSYMRTADIGIHPIRKYPNAEIALPNKIFEYLGSGLPVVVSNNAAMEKFVTEHNCGKVFVDGNEDSLAESINTAIAIGYDARELKSLAERFCWESQEFKLKSIYDSYKLCSEVHVSDKKSSVLQLPTSSAGQPSILSKCLNIRGVASKSLSVAQHGYGYKSDIDFHFSKFDRPIIRRYVKILNDFDVLHYHSRTLCYNQKLIYPTGLDVIIAKMEGKKVFFHFRGGEARRKSLFSEKEFNYVESNPNNVFTKYSEASQENFLKLISSICDGVFVVDPELQSYMPRALIVPRVVDVANIEEYLSVCDNSKQKKTFTIAHAPSNKEIKGTNYIASAIESLKEKGYNIDFKLVEGMNHHEALKEYAKADIVIDQVRIGWYGVLAVEAMALGKPVVSYIRNDLKHYLPKQKPVVSANPKNIETVLERLLNDGELRELTASSARKYVRELHDAPHVAETLEYVYATMSIDKNYSELVEYLNPLPRKQISPKPKVKINNFIAAKKYCSLQIKKFHSLCGERGFIYASKLAFKKILEGRK